VQDICGASNSTAGEWLLAEQFSSQDDSDVFEFILEEIDSVPELEALLLLWHSSPTPWTPVDLAKRLYVSPEVAGKLLIDLTRKKLLTAVPNRPGSYCCEAKSQEQNQVIARIDEIYRREIVRVSTLIHSKPSSAVRDFARAFRFTKGKE